MLLGPALQAGGRAAVRPGAPQGGAQQTSCVIRGRAPRLPSPLPESPLWLLRVQRRGGELGLASTLGLIFHRGSMKDLGESLLGVLWAKF